MNVLLVEDRGASEYYVSEWLRQEGHTVFDAFNPADAQSIWEERENVPIHCIILDLNMPSDGLTMDQKNRSEGGVLCGWVWLEDNVLSVAPQMRNHIIIYSDYIPILKDKIASERYKDISLFSKRRRSGSAKEVTARIHKIDQLM